MDEDSINNIEDEELSNIIILSDENGEDVQFEFLDLIEYDSEEYVSSAQCVFDSTIKVYELLGAEVYLYFDLAEFPITARVDSRTTARPGDAVKFAFDVDKIHVFDKETEQVITN